MNARAARLAAAALLLSGCAGSQLVAQWNDPQFAGQPPRGAKVMVDCQATEPTLRRLCVDRTSEQLLGAGVQPLPAPQPAPPDEATLLRVAASAGAVALWRSTIAPEVAAAAPAPSIGIGIGGFGGGYRSGGGVGIGMSAPIGGGGPAQTGYGAALTDVASGRLMWSARASASPSADVNQQLAQMAAQLMEGARQSGLFAR